MKKKAVGVLLLFSLCISPLVSCQNTGDNQNPSLPAAETETPAYSPDSGWHNLPINTTALNGETVTYTDLSNNKLTILNIWATWCPPCVAELPELQEVSQAFLEQGVQVIGVLQDGVTEAGQLDDKTIDKAKILLESANADYTVILPDETLTMEFISTMQYFPTTFFIDGEGNVIHEVIGAKTFEDWSDEINEVLSEIS